MRVPEDRELLALWERGSSRHPIDRALLLGMWARPEVQPDRLAELPVGALNSALLRLREAWFGSRIEAVVDCANCGTRAELILEVKDLLEAAIEGDERAELQLAGFRFRVPDSRDLAAIASCSDRESAALRLLERICVAGPESGGAEPGGLLAEVEAGLEVLDPAADFELALVCAACGEEWGASFPVAELLWDELDSRARTLLAEVHALARSYGWSESEILGLSSRRRAIYIEMAET